MKAWTNLTQAAKSQQQRREAGCFFDTRGMKAQFEWNEENNNFKLEVISNLLARAVVLYHCQHAIDYLIVVVQY